MGRQAAGVRPAGHGKRREDLGRLVPLPLWPGAVYDARYLSRDGIGRRPRAGARRAGEGAKRRRSREREAGQSRGWYVGRAMRTLSRGISEQEEPETAHGQGI